ncbi:hypothetical protein E2C01_021079 [Portunus trituberculatus]|uniref:Uncharacterized protein n=1 Tax=Portunus trituberculatus TaxID=210409 RepID=A0A5B7E1S5_PORTR|nr:hypothetical protein [Portunus trituberculatus]
MDRILKRLEHSSHYFQRYSLPGGGRPRPRLRENPGIQWTSQGEVQTAVDLLAIARLFRRVLYRTGSERFIGVVVVVVVLGVVQTDVLGVMDLATVQ